MRTYPFRNSEYRSHQQKHHQPNYLPQLSVLSSQTVHHGILGPSRGARLLLFVSTRSRLAHALSTTSTIDNTINHGPGGQGGYEDTDEADPCFAKIVPGYEPVLDRVHRSEVQPGGYMGMKHNVAIRHMRLLPKDEAKELLLESKIQILDKKEKEGKLDVAD